MSAKVVSDAFEFDAFVCRCQAVNSDKDSPWNAMDE
jgi:hypothetical protein